MIRGLRHCDRLLRSCRLSTSLNRTKVVMSSQSVGQMESAITIKLTEAFTPHYLDVKNESFMHNVPKGSETHFKVVVVSDSFNGKRQLQRHRVVHDVLRQELEAGVHALSIVAKTALEWQQSNTVLDSPPCRGGAGL